MRHSAVILAGAMILTSSVGQGAARRRSRPPAAGPDDATYQVYQLLDDSYGGKLKDFCLLADVYKDSQDTTKEYQRVLSVDYDKNRFFARLEIHVRSVAKLTLDQLKTYTPKQIFDFGVSDTDVFDKINPGPFGGEGDLYLRAHGGGPPAQADVTDEVREEYTNYLTQFILPVLRKK